MASDGKYDELPDEHDDGTQTDDDAEERGDGGAKKRGGPSPKSRGFTVTYYTDNNKEAAEDFLRKQAKTARYLIAGLEWTKEGKEHFQTYIHYKNPRSFNSVRKLFAPWHVEIARGTPLENYEYCRKIDETSRKNGVKPNEYVIEIGDMPAQGTRADIEQAKTMIVSGATMKEVALSISETYVKYHAGLEKLRAHMLDKERTTKTEVIVLWGQAGTGKTMTAEAHGAKLVKYTPSGFTQGYDYQDVVYIDELDDGEIPRSMLLQYMDRYQLVINVKGGEKRWAPKVLYITSNKDPKNWYGGDLAVKRRLDKVFHLTSVDGKTVFTDQTAEYDAIRAHYCSMPTPEQMALAAPSQ